MRKPKFNTEVFFQSFSKLNLPEYMISRPHMLFDYSLSRGFGYDGYDDLTSGREWINLNYSSFENPKKSFNNLDKLIEYIPLIQLIDNDPDGVFISKEEYGFLSSKKSNISFIINSYFFHGDSHSNEDPQPILIFKKFDKKKQKELPKILLKNFKKKTKNKGILNFSNLVNLNNSFTWDNKLLGVAFKEDSKSRKKYKKKLENDGLYKPDWYFNIWFFLTTEKKMISKDPTSTNLFKAVMSLR